MTFKKLFLLLTVSLAVNLMPIISAASTDDNEDPSSTGAAGATAGMVDTTIKDEKRVSTSGQLVPTATAATGSTISPLEISITGTVDFGAKFPLHWISPEMGTFIKSLSFDGLTFTWHPEFFNNCPSLESLSVLNCTISFTTHKNPARNFLVVSPTLRLLDLSGSRAVNGQSSTEAFSTTVISFLASEELIRALFNRAIPKVHMTDAAGTPMSTDDILKAFLTFSETPKATEVVNRNALGFGGQPNLSPQLRNEMSTLYKRFREASAASSASS